MTDDVLQRFSPRPRHGSEGRSVRPLLPRRAPGRRSAPDTTRWSWRPPVRARPCRRSSGRWTGWPPERRPPRRSSAARALRLAAQGARRRRRAEPAVAAGRHRPRRRPAGPAELPDITVAVRSGDTPAGRAAGVRQGTPPDILITTPESLFLMLTSSARETLTGVETVIVDEVHAVAGTKRGAHLALSLERLDAAAAQRRPSESGCRRPCDRSTRWRASSRAAVPSTSCSHRRPRSGPRGRRPAGRHVSARRGRPRTSAVPPPASSAGPRSGRTSRSASSTSWPPTARRWCSPTPGGWPSG